MSLEIPPDMPKITFAATGETHEVPDGTRFIDFCQENDLPHDFGCTVGSCGTCALVVTEGGADLPAVGDEEAETVEMATGDEGARLGCLMVVNCDMTIKAAEV